MRKAAIGNNRLIALIPVDRSVFPLPSFVYLWDTFSGSI